MKQAVKVESVIFLDDVYPRDSFDQEAVNRYRQAIDMLPPIEITHEGILIDGYHRLIAHRVEQRETIQAIVEQLDKADVLWEATRRNAIHGLQLSMKDKKKLARRFYGENGRKQADIAEVLSVSTGSISAWVRDLKEKQDEERDTKIWQMWLSCHTEQEIADSVGDLTRQRINQILDNARKFKSEEICIPDSLQLFNLWNFQDCDPRYGMDYPGRIPGQIIENLLYYYTEPFDTVIDPMAGGGTTIDVCKVMSRRYRAYDISPVRDDIKKHSITSGFPPECKGCDFIFLDPPYWSQRKGEYSDAGENLANLSMVEFYDRMKVIFNSAHDMLGPGGHIAVIIGPTQKKGIIHDHAYILNKMLSAIFGTHDGQFVNRIIVPYTTQQAKPYHVTDAKEGRYMLKRYRDLLVYRK